MPPESSAGASPPLAGDTLAVSALAPESTTDSGPPPEKSSGSSPKAATARKSGVRSWIEWIIVVGGAILLAIVLRTFVIQVFSIPSESMQPALTDGDRVAVEKLTYLRRDPERGDMIVFDNPQFTGVSTGGRPAPEKLIKRVIGIGGDKIVLNGQGRVEVNGTAIDEPYIMPGSRSLPLNSTKYPCTETKPCVVPDGSLWVMGDNRQESQDSRAFGPIPADTVVGRALSVIWPVDRWQGL